MGTILRWLVFGLLPYFSASASARRLAVQHQNRHEAKGGWDDCSQIAEGGTTRSSFWRRSSTEGCKCHRGWVITGSHSACQPFRGERYFPTSLQPGLCKCAPASLCALQAQQGRKPVFMYGSTGLEQIKAQVKNPNLIGSKAVLPGYSRIFAINSSTWSGGLASLYERPSHETFGYVVFLTEAEALLQDTYEVDSRSRDCREQCSGEHVQACREACSGSANPWAASPTNEGRRISVTAQVYGNSHEETEMCEAMAYVINEGYSQNKDKGLRWQEYPSYKYLAAIARSIAPFWKGLDQGSRIDEHEEFASLDVYGIEDVGGSKIRQYLKWWPPSEMADELGLRNSNLPDTDPDEEHDDDDLPDADTVPTWRIKEGYLMKQSRYWQEWRQRWVVLTYSMLSTYESKLDHQQATEAIKLSDIKTVKQAADEIGTQYALKVETQDRSVYLYAESFEEQASWINAIAQQMLLLS